jgi:DNA-binding IclR family transcriptional regulator
MIQSVDRAVQILLALQGARRLGVTELAERLSLPKGTVHGLLRTLAGRGMVEQDPAGGQYRLGPAVLRLGNVYLDSLDLRARSLRWTERLAQRSGQAVRLGVLALDEVLVIHHVFRPDGSLQVPEVGISVPAHASALGKALLAFRKEDRDRRLAEPLPRLTGSTVVDADRLRRELEQVAETGVAMERDEAVLGESGVAATIFDVSGWAVGAVAVVFPTSQDDPPVEELEAMVAETARGVTRELGGATWPGEAR